MDMAILSVTELGNLAAFCARGFDEPKHLAVLQRMARMLSIISKANVAAFERDNPPKRETRYRIKSLKREEIFGVAEAFDRGDAKGDEQMALLTASTLEASALSSSGWRARGRGLDRALVAVLTEVVRQISRALPAQRPTAD